MSIESAMFPGFLEESWTRRDVRDPVAGKMWGSTFGLCEECLGGGSSSGLHIGETGGFMMSGSMGPETGDSVLTTADMTDEHPRGIDWMSGSIGPELDFGAGRPLGQTFSFCQECVPDEDVGVVIGATGAFLSDLPREEEWAPSGLVYDDADLEGGPIPGGGSGFVVTAGPPPDDEEGGFCDFDDVSEARRQFIELAWKMLVAEYDFVEAFFDATAIAGWDVWKECHRKRVFGEAPRVQVSVMSLEGDGLDGACGWVPDGEIQVMLDSVWLECLLAVSLTSGYGEMTLDHGSPGEWWPTARLFWYITSGCALIDLSTVLAHEILHTCQEEGVDNDVKETSARALSIWYRYWMQALSGWNGMTAQGCNQGGLSACIFSGSCSEELLKENDWPFSRSRMMWSMVPNCDT